MINIDRDAIRLSKNFPRHDYENDNNRTCYDAHVDHNVLEPDSIHPSIVIPLEQMKLKKATRWI